MKKEFDVIIVGAGPAGCSAATFLALKGYEVLLVDKAKFPRDKVCGDGISPLALEVLDRLGVHREIENKNPWRIDGIELFSPAGQGVTANFSHLEGPYKHGWVLPRKEFDYLLLQHAQSFSGVHFMENCEVMDLDDTGIGLEGIKAKCGDSVEEFTGKVVLGADGVYSLMARKVFPRRKFPQSHAFAVRAYFHGVKGLTHHLEIRCPRTILPGYGWIFPTGEDSANVGVGISSRLLGKKDIRKLFDIFIHENGSLKGRFRYARLVENSFRGWPIPMGAFFPQRSHKNLLLIGDAGCFADGITGEGIYYALRSGEFAAEAVHGGLSRPDGMKRMGEVYEKLWGKAFNRKEYLIGSLLQKFIVTQPFLNFNVRRAAQNPVMARNLASILCHQKSKIRLLF